MSGQINHFGTKMVHPRNFRSTLSFILIFFCIIKRTRRYIKVLLNNSLRVRVLDSGFCSLETVEPYPKKRQKSFKSLYLWFFLKNYWSGQISVLGSFTFFYFFLKIFTRRLRFLFLNKIDITQ